MDGPGTYSQPPYAGGSKDESGTAAKDTISIGSGDRVSGEDRMGMEVHSSCCNMDKGIYYYRTYENSQITAVDMHRTDLDGSSLTKYPLRKTQQIRHE